MNKLLPILWRWPLMIISLGQVTYAAEHPLNQQTYRPLLNLTDYFQIFESSVKNNTIINLKTVVLERAIAKGVFTLPSQNAVSAWNFGERMPASEFLRLLFDEAMKDERIAIINQIQNWELDLMKVANYFLSSLGPDVPLLRKFTSVHSMIKEESWVLPDLLWYYFSLEGRGEDLRINMRFKNAVIDHKSVFSDGSVLLVWPEFLHSTFFPRNFLGHQMVRTDNAFTKFDQAIIEIGEIMEEYGVEPRERMAIYGLLSKIRQNPALILKAEFAAEVIHRWNGSRILSLLDEVNRIGVSRSRLIMGAFISTELAKRPAIGRMLGELTTQAHAPEPGKLRRSCISFFGRFFNGL